MSSFLLDGEEETLRAGAIMANLLREGDFVGLVGNLGAGKTCFVRGLIGVLSAEVQVTSPTYTLINIYAVSEPIASVAHVDLYRLADLDDLESTGYWDVLDENGLCIVEWIDHVPEAVPADDVWLLRLEHRGAMRALSVERGPEERRERVRALLGESFACEGS